MIDGLNVINRTPLIGALPLNQEGTAHWSLCFNIGDSADRLSGGRCCDIALSFIFQSKNPSRNAAGVQPIDCATIRDASGAGNPV